jgi:hypothetical protein
MSIEPGEEVRFSDLQAYAQNMVFSVNVRWIENKIDEDTCGTKGISIHSTLFPTHRIRVARLTTLRRNWGRRLLFLEASSKTTEVRPDGLESQGWLRLSSNYILNFSVTLMYHRFPFNDQPTRGRWSGS